jgi:hypothetical protein
MKKRVYVVFLNHEISCFYYEQDKAEQEVNDIRAAGQSAWLQAVNLGNIIEVGKKKSKETDFYGLHPDHLNDIM